LNFNCKIYFIIIFLDINNLIICVVVVIVWNQYLSRLTLWVRIRSWRGVMNTTLCDKVCQWLAAGRWLSPCTPVSSTIKTDRHDISEILLKVAFWTHLTKTYLLLIVFILWNTSDILVLFKFVLRTYLVEAVGTLSNLGTSAFSRLDAIPISLSLHSAAERHIRRPWKNKLMTHKNLESATTT
jgi:hypothetical protein